MTSVLVLVAAIAIAVDLYSTGLNQLGRRLQTVGRRMTKRAAKMARVRLVTVGALALVAIAAV